MHSLIIQWTKYQFERSHLILCQIQGLLFKKVPENQTSERISSKEFDVKLIKDIIFKLLSDLSVLVVTMIFCYISRKSLGKTKPAFRVLVIEPVFVEGFQGN